MINLTGYPKARLTDVDLLLDGNSLFNFLSAPENAAVYASLGGSARNKQNYAVSGQTTAQMIADGVAQIDPQYQANKILIGWEGRNHLYQGATILQAQEAIRNYCLARKQAGWRICLLNLTPTTSTNFAVNNTGGSFEAALQAFNQYIAANYKGFADTLVDVRAVSALQNPSNTTIYYDGLHLSTDGYAALIPAINTAIERIRK
jgi:lysophospholipase L1-like esterase